MPPPNITITLATDSDATTLASIMTAAFSHSDTIYPLIWGSVPSHTHYNISKYGLFTPMQKPHSLTFKASSPCGTILGFATWILPREPGEEKKGFGGLPEIPGINMDLWNEKVAGPRKFAERDVNESKDMELSLCFVHPDHQRQGVASRLLEWGKKEANEEGASIWLTATPQAVPVYEKAGWEVVERVSIDLSRYGGVGEYVRAWMCRKPLETKGR